MGERAGHAHEDASRRCNSARVAQGFGELVKGNTSDHDWLEGAAVECWGGRDRREAACWICGSTNETRLAPRVPHGHSCLLWMCEYNVCILWIAVIFFLLPPPGLRSLRI